MPAAAPSSEASLGERLEFARHLAGISARELDRLAGRKEGHTRLIERGDRPRNEVETIDDLARALGVSLDWLVRGEGDAPTAAQVQAAIAQARSHQPAA